MTNLRKGIRVPKYGVRPLTLRALASMTLPPQIRPISMSEQHMYSVMPGTS